MKYTCHALQQMELLQSFIISERCHCPASGSDQMYLQHSDNIDLILKKDDQSVLIFCQRCTIQ